jgi:hypothetical protein
MQVGGLRREYPESRQPQSVRSRCRGTRARKRGWKRRANWNWRMIGELILRAATLTFLIGVFVYAFVINL